MKIKGGYQILDLSSMELDAEELVITDDVKKQILEIEKVYNGEDKLISKPLHVIIKSSLFSSANQCSVVSGYGVYELKRGMTVINVVLPYQEETYFSTRGIQIIHTSTNEWFVSVGLIESQS